MSTVSPTSTTTTTDTSGTSGSTAGTGSTSTSGASVSSPPFSIAGLASGLDTNSIIDKLDQVYSQPLTQVQQAQSLNIQQQSAWNDVQTKVTALQTAIQTLQAPAAAAATQGAVTPPVGVTAAPLTVTTSPQAAIGSFTVNVTSLATTAQLTGSAGISNPITNTAATTSPLASEGFGTTPTLGTFIVNGTTITVDASTTLLGGAGTDSIQAMINAIPNLTFTANMSGSNVQSVTIASTTVPGTPIQLGAPGDTSNVLSVLGLTSSNPTTSGTPATYSITTNGSLSGINTNATLGASNLAGAISGSGSFNINGKTVSYTNTDTMNTLLANINAANAGVSAAYDPLSDRVVLTATTTGTGGISVSDPGGSGIPAALGLTGAGASMTAGLPAVFTISGINGGNPIASASNTVNGIVPGVTLNLTGVSTGGASTVNITQDTSALSTALQGFVTAYNAVQDDITKYTGIQTQNNTSTNATTPSAGLLAGDSTLSDFAYQLDRTVNGLSVTIGGQSYSLANLGISTGIPGSNDATTVPTLDLTFDQTAFSAGITGTPGLAAAFIGNGNASSQTGTLFQSLGQLAQSWTQPLGVISDALDALTAEYADQTDEINNWQLIIQSEHDHLVTQFSNMEATLSTIQAQGQALNAALGISTSSTSSSTPSSSSSSTTGG